MPVRWEPPDFLTCPNHDLLLGFSLSLVQNGEVAVLNSCSAPETNGHSHLWHAQNSTGFHEFHTSPRRNADGICSLTSTCVRFAKKHPAILGLHVTLVP